MLKNKVETTPPPGVGHARTIHDQKEKKMKVLEYKDGLPDLANDYTRNHIVSILKKKP